MEAMTDYFGNFPVLHKLVWLTLCLSMASLVELIIPFIRSKYSRSTHLKTNGLLLITTLVVNALFSIFLVKLSPYLSAHHIGLFHVVKVPPLAQLIISLLVLDLLAQYTIHYLLHMVPFLWKFHMVHHSDTHVNATTGTRHHPIDYIARETFSLLTVIALGVPAAYYVFYRLLTVFCTYFTHANISIPVPMDRILRLIIVTPHLHKFHHHYKAPWTDRNFGNVFSIWDRLFGTLIIGDKEEITYGVDTMDPTRSNSAAYQLTKPFHRT